MEAPGGGGRRWRHALLAVIGEIGTEPEREALRHSLERGKPSSGRQPSAFSTLDRDPRPLRRRVGE